MATFNDLEDNTAGTLTLQFTAPNVPAVISDSSTVAPAGASTLAIKRPPSGVTSGVAFPLDVDAMDPYGNLATSFDGAVTVGVASGTGTPERHCHHRRDRRSRHVQRPGQHHER